MNENLKVENIASFLNGTMKIRDFRRFLAEEIIRAESLRFAIGRNDGKLTEIVKFCLASTLAYKYEKRDGRVFFVPDHA